MKDLSIGQIAQAAGGTLAAGAEAELIRSVSTDTRRIEPGAVFFALKGERFDANDFAPQALASGAAAVVVDRWDGELPAHGAVIQVPDTLLALQRLARWYRRQRELPVIGITGSNGKTSTKDFTSAVLSQAYEVCATRGNLNNHIGVPLSVLSLEDRHTAAVFEMGMNHPGEIAPLCEIALPQIGIITNIGTAHIEYMGSREAIAEEKGALAKSLPSDGALLVTAGCDFLEYFKRRTRARVIAVGNGRGVVRAEDLRQEQEGNSRFTLVIEDRPVAEVNLPVTGRHMVKNALLAAGAGWFLGMNPEAIAAGLSSTKLTSGRLRRYSSHGVIVFDDTYNANPESMAAAIETLAETPLTGAGRRFAVLGRMGELGPHAPEAHLRVGRLAAERGLTVLAVGEGSRGIADGAGQTLHFPDGSEAAGWLAANLRAGDVALFKASRSAAIERVMNQAFPPDN